MERMEDEQLRMWAVEMSHGNIDIAASIVDFVRPREAVPRKISLTDKQFHDELTSSDRL